MTKPPVEELETAEALGREQSAQSIEEARIAKLEELVKAIKEGSVVFPDNSSETKAQEKTKLSLVEIFCRQSQQFNDVVEFLEATAGLLKLPEKLTFASLTETSKSEHPFASKGVQRLFNTPIIKLNQEENLIEQFVKEKVDLQFINKQINEHRVNKHPDLSKMNPFSKYHQLIPIKLEDGTDRTLNLDVKQYAKDVFEHYQLEHNTKLNSQQDSTNSQRENQRHELPGFLALYAKEEFLKKYPHESSNFLSEKDKEEIVGLKKLGKLIDERNEKFLINLKELGKLINERNEKFLIKAGFKKPPQQNNPQEQNINEGPPSGPQKSSQEQNINEGPPSGPQKSSQEQNINEGPPLGPQNSNREQPALGPKGILKKSPTYNSFPEPPTENQTEGINYLPTPLFEFKPAFQASNNKKQPFAEEPPSGPQKSSQEQPPSGAENRDRVPYYIPTPLPSDKRVGSEKKTPNIPADLGNKTPGKGVNWAEKMEQVKFIPGRTPTGR